jgi:hypothetical protein
MKTGDPPAVPEPEDAASWGPVLAAGQPLAFELRAAATAAGGAVGAAFPAASAARLKKLDARARIKEGNEGRAKK